MVGKIEQTKNDSSTRSGQGSQRYEYSDGPVENDILDYVSSDQDLNKLSMRDGRWPVLYHLSSMRRDLLEWYDFPKDGSLLEVGAGCGALTGLFCERVRKVTAVEISPRRAAIIEKRHANHDNLKVYAGRLQDIPLKEKFDVVTLIGVLEYAGTYGSGLDPYVAMIEECARLVKEHGVLIVAMENRLGLKYWAGAPEDHTGKLFHGLEGYPDRPGIRTMGRKELIDLLAKGGLGHVEMYYPWPDYKLPHIIYSDHIKPGVGAFSDPCPNYDQPRYRLFDEALVADALAENDLSSELANSFLAVCRR